MKSRTIKNELKQLFKVEKLNFNRSEILIFGFQMICKNNFIRKFSQDIFPSYV